MTSCVIGRSLPAPLRYPVERLGDFAASEREVCLTRNLPVGEAWRPTNVGALVWLQRQPAFTVPERVTPLGTALYTPEGQPVLELAGYEAVAVERARAAVSDLARLATDSLEYGVRLSAEWRKLAVDTTRRVVEQTAPRA